MMKRLLFTLLFIFGLYGYAFAQREVSGRVTDAKGEGIPGASVLIKGTTQGTSTDLDGSFKLKVRSDLDVLVFSGVGLATKETVVGSQSSFNLTLEEDVKVLDKEVVITGYREFNRDQAVSTVAVIDKKYIEQVPMGSFDQILQGRAAGLQVSSGNGQPGANAAVRIRGIGSIIGGTAPLYLVDGVAISPGDFSNMNANDFESVSVLKDGPSISQYGSRGANGVILITTKRGSRDGKATVTYRALQGWTMPSRPSFFKRMNTSERIEFERRAFNAVGTSFGGIGDILAGAGTSQQKEAAIATLAQTDTYWPDYFLRTGNFTSHELNISGGMAKTRYYVSGSYRKEAGIVTRTDLERYNFRVNLDQEISKSFRIGISSTFGTNRQAAGIVDGDGVEATTNGNFLSVDNPLYQMYVVLPYYSPLRPDGSYSPAPGGTGNFPLNFNVLKDHELNNRKNTNIKLVGGAYLEYDLPVKGLSFRSNIGFDYSQAQNNVVISRYSPSGGNNIAPVGTASTPTLGTGGLFSRNFSTFRLMTWTNTLRYNRTFKEKHNVSAVLGHETFERYIYSFTGSARDVNGSLGFPIAATPASLANANTFSNNETRNHIISFFADATYSFDKRYNISIGARRDGSSRFGSNQRFANFYSLGASWNAHNEDFLKNVFGEDKALSTFLLRVNYGISGNQEIGGTSDALNFRSLAIYEAAGAYNGIQGLRPSSVPNPNLTWEKANNFGAGFDLGLFKNRVILTIDYYDRTTTELLIAKQIPLSTGFSNPTINAGSMRNRGIEVRAQVAIIKTNNFEWNLDANFTYNQNKVLDLADNERIFTGSGNGLSVAQKDHPIQSFYLTRWAGVNPVTGEGQYLDPDGNISTSPGSENYVILGKTSIAPIFGGVTNTFIINKNLDISFFFIYNQGNYLYNNSDGIGYASGGFFPGRNKHPDMLNFWTPQNRNTDIPSIGWNSGNDLGQSDRHLQSGSYVRLRNVMVGYNFPREIFKSWKISGVRIYAQAQNLLTFTNYRGLDPEKRNDEEAYNYPMPRTFNIGADIKF
ncbi:MAG: SusC/RagA family TonB-linked outer membrane protein [Bacteroidetes bacterium]|nr:MAG: SusC/RagA family TonB-linked outer membrane protein [Bacteroidota bacterium]